MGLLYLRFVQFHQTIYDDNQIRILQQIQLYITK